jgi:hypothetical protein
MKAFKINLERKKDTDKKRKRNCFTFEKVDLKMTKTERKISILKFE